MSIKSIAILANPKAGRNTSTKISARLKEKLNRKSIESTIYIDEWPAKEVLYEYTDCWIVGGDGTINYFINQYPDCKLSLAIFDGGTGNDFAWKLYGDDTIEIRFEKVLNAIPKFIDAAKVNDTLYINCLGVGFDGEIIKSMNAIRLLGGRYGYLLAVLYKIFTFKESYITIKTKNEFWAGEFLLAFIVNSSRAGGGFFIAPTAEIHDGQLDLVLCKKIPIWKRLVSLPIIKKGNHLNKKFILHQLDTNFIIETENDLPIQIDGELLYAKKLIVQVLPNQFLFKY